MSNNFHAQEEFAERGFSRRRFLMQALGLSAAGLAVGGGAAWTRSRLEAGAEAEAEARVLQTQLADVSATKSALDLSVSTLNTHLADLRSQLDGALSQNGHLASALSVSQQEAADLKTQLANKQAELDVTHAQLSRSKELISLYDVLDRIDLDATVEAGLAAVAGGLTTSLNLIPALQEGLVKARILLADFEQSLPDIQAAMNWVGEQVVILKLGLYAIEIAAQRTINELITGLEAVFGGFVKFILDHLPFGVGENVRQTLAVTQKLLVSLPDVADGLNEKVLGQISPRVNEGAKHWKRSLVEPIREKALSPTGELLHQLSETNAVFSNTLQTPVKTALEQRAELRKQIETFRQAHNL